MTISLSTSNPQNSINGVPNTSNNNQLDHQASPDAHHYNHTAIPGSVSALLIQRIIEAENQSNPFEYIEAQRARRIQIEKVFQAALMSVEDPIEVNKIIEQRVTKGFLMNVDLEGFTAAGLSATESTQPLSREHIRKARAESRNDNVNNDPKRKSQSIVEIDTRYTLLDREISGGVSRIAGVAQTVSELAEYAVQLGLTVLVSEGDSFTVYAEDFAYIALFARYVQIRFSKETNARGFKELKSRIGINSVSENNDFTIYRDSKVIYDREKNRSHYIIYTVGGSAIEDVDQVQHHSKAGGIAIANKLYNQLPSLPISQERVDTQSVQLNWSSELQSALGTLPKYKEGPRSCIREIVAALPIAYAILNVNEVSPEIIQDLLESARISNLRCLKVVSITGNKIPLILSPFSDSGTTVQIIQNLKRFRELCIEMGIKGSICASKGQLWQGQIASNIDYIGTPLTEASRGANGVAGDYDDIQIVFSEQIRTSMIEEGRIPNIGSSIDIEPKGYQGRVRFYYYKGEINDPKLHDLEEMQLQSGEMLELLTVELFSKGYDLTDAAEIIDRIRILSGQMDIYDNSANLDGMSSDLIDFRTEQLKTFERQDVQKMCQVVLGALYYDKDMAVTSILLKLNQYVTQLHYPKRAIDERLTYQEREALRKLSAVTFGVNEYWIRMQTAQFLGISPKIIDSLKGSNFVSTSKRPNSIKLNTPFATYLDVRMPQDLRENVHGQITEKLLYECSNLLNKESGDLQQNYPLFRSLALHFNYTSSSYFDQLSDENYEAGEYLIKGLREMFDLAWMGGRYLDIATVGLRLTETCSTSLSETNDYLFKIAYSHTVLGNNEKANAVLSQISNLSEENLRKITFARENQMRLFLWGIEGIDESELALGRDS